MSSGWDSGWPEDDDDAADTGPLPVLNPLPGLFEAPSLPPASLPGPVHTGGADDDSGRPRTDHRGVAGPPPRGAADASAGEFGPFVVREPRRTPIDVKRFAIPAATAVAAIALISLIVWVFRGGGDSDQTAAPSSQTEAPATESEQLASPAQQARLTSLLPKEYAAAGVCRPVPVDVSTGAVARVQCEAPAGSAAPATATYTLAAAADRLTPMLDALMGDSAVQTCPGRIQSPGPWGPATADEKNSGTLFCGLAHRDAAPVLAWTDTRRLLFAELHARPSSSSSSPDDVLDGMYQWWSRNS